MALTPIFSMTPICTSVKIPSANALIITDGSSTAGGGASYMTNLCTIGAEGAFLDKITFTPVGTTVGALSTACTLNIFLSTVAAPGTNQATTAANTGLIGQVSAPITVTNSPTNPTPSFTFLLNMMIKDASYQYIHVAQSIAQTNVQWQAVIWYGNY